MKNTSETQSGSHSGQNARERFKTDVLHGLGQNPKHLDSKYFYDEKGDVLFQQIMALPEYYLTRCELDIFQNRLPELTEVLSQHGNKFDVIELGAGDGTKSRFLLSHLLKNAFEITYYPIDISGHILNVLSEDLKEKLPELDCRPLHGEYFEMLQKAHSVSSRPKLVMLLGSTIGNMEPEDARGFCAQLRQQLNSGDIVLIGFDLMKHPRTIRDAYDDASGVTAAFNLNLLERMNRELGATFDVAKFEHYQTYNPLSGACKSYLISLADQCVQLSGETIHFELNEPVYMEISQKFSLRTIEQLASATGFNVLRHVRDSKGWFANSLWRPE